RKLTRFDSQAHGFDGLERAEPFLDCLQLDAARHELGLVPESLSRTACLAECTRSPVGSGFLAGALVGSHEGRGGPGLLAQARISGSSDLPRAFHPHSSDPARPRAGQAGEDCLTYEKVLSAVCHSGSATP